MPTYKVLSVARQDDWSPEPGKTFAVYAVGVGDAETGLAVADDAGNPIVAQMFQPPDAPPPSVGAVLNNKRLNKTKRGYSLKRDESVQAQGTGGGPAVSQQEQDIEKAAQSSGFGAGQMSKDDYWRAKDRRDVAAQKRMGRAHAQEMAVRVVTLRGLAPDSTAEQIQGALTAWTNWFQADVDRAA